MNLECTICFMPFDLAENLPMSLECGHTFCKSCVGFINTCPSDRKKIAQAKVQKNFSLISLIEEEHQQRKKLGLNLLRDEINCREHGHQRILFCLADQVAICQDCALFGVHKGHDIRKLEQIRGEHEKLAKGSSVKPTWTLEQFFDHPAELKARQAVIQEVKKKTIKLIEIEFAEFLERALEEKEVLVQQVENCFAVADRYTNRMLTCKRVFAEKALTTFPQVASAPQENPSSRIEDMAQQLADHRGVQNQVKSLREGLQKIDLNSKLNPLVNSIACGVESVLSKRSLTVDTPNSLLMNKLNLLDILTARSSKSDSVQIMVRNLPTSMTESEIVEFFDCCGSVREIKLGRQQGKFSGYCELTFETVEAAKSCFLLNGLLLAKRPLVIEFFVDAEKETGFKVPNQSAKGKSMTSGKEERTQKKTEKPPSNPFFKNIYAEDSNSD